MPAPDINSLKTYLGTANVWTDAQLTSALAAEKAAQSGVCRVPATRTAAITTANASATVTAPAGTFLSTDVAGDITATGVPAGATILSVAADGTSAVMSANATASGSVTATLSQLWAADLAQALHRRAHRNLEMRTLPYGTQPAPDGIGVIRVGGTDYETRRLEAPYRKWVVG